MLEDDNDTEELPPLEPQMRKVANLEHDRHGAAHQGIMGVVHVVRVYEQAIAPPLWKTRCGWRFGCKHPPKWRLLDENEDLLPFAVCDRCAGSNAG